MNSAQMEKVVNIQDLHSSEEQPTVCAIVLNWNGYTDTVQCIESMKKATYPHLDLVLVDNGSTDGSADRISQMFPDLQLIRLRSNAGYAAGNNAGIRHALAKGYEYILIINNDVVVNPGFIEPMITVLKTKSSVGIGTCKALLQSNPSRIYTTAGEFSKLRCSGIPRPQREIDQEGDASYISGCLMLVKRKVFETVGLLDEKFFLYFEDVEFSRRVYPTFGIYYTPKGLVYHKSGGGQSWASYNSTYLYYTIRNRFLAFQNDPLLYRVYVFFFNLMIAMLKMLVILTSISTGVAVDNKMSRIRAIWNGFKDGLGFRQPRDA